MRRQIGVALVLVLMMSFVVGQALAASVVNYSFDNGLDGWYQPWAASTYGETTVADVLVYPAWIWQSVPSDSNELTVYYRVWAVRGSYFQCELYLNYVHQPLSYDGRTGIRVRPQPYWTGSPFVQSGVTATWTVESITEQTYDQVVGDWYLVKCVVSTPQDVFNWRPQVYGEGYEPRNLKVDFIDAEAVDVHNYSFNDGLDGWYPQGRWDAATYGETTVADVMWNPAWIWQNAPSDLNELTVYYRIWAVRGSWFQYFQCELYLNYVHQPLSYDGRTGIRVWPQPYLTGSPFVQSGVTATWTVESITEQTYDQVVGDWYLVKCVVSTQQDVFNWRPQVYASSFGPRSLKVDYIDTGYYSENRPNAPTDPTCDDFGSRETARFSWTFSDPDPQDISGGFKLRIRPVGSYAWLYAQTDGTLGDETWVRGSNSYWDLHNGILDDDYEWQVATMDQNEREGPYCELAYFNVTLQSYWFSQLTSEGEHHLWDRTNLDDLYFPDMAWCSDCGVPQPEDPSQWKCRNTPLWTDSSYTPGSYQHSAGHMNKWGCYICSWAMVLRNHNAMTVSEQLDFPRTGADGHLTADPFTVTMANLSWQEVDQVGGEYHIVGYEDANSPVSIRDHYSLVGNFGLTIDSIDMTNTEEWTPEAKAGKLTELLNEHSGGLVVRVRDASNPNRRHTLVFTKSTYVPSPAARAALDKLVISPVSKEAAEQDARILYDHTRDTEDRATEGTAWDEFFWVCDPGPTDPAEGDNVPFEESWTHRSYGGLDRVYYVWWIE